MTRVCLLVLGLSVLTAIGAIAGPVRAGEYYSSSYGDSYYSGYRTSYYDGKNWSDCHYRKVVRYEKMGRYYEWPHYRDSYHYTRSCYPEASYSRPYYRSTYYSGPRYYGGYHVSYTSVYYDAYNRYNECAVRPMHDGHGGWVSSVKAGCY